MGVGVYAGLCASSFPPRIIKASPEKAISTVTSWLAVIFSPRMGPARKRDTKGAQLTTIATTVSGKYFAAITIMKIPKFPEIILEIRGGTDPRSTLSYKICLILVL